MSPAVAISTPTTGVAAPFGDTTYTKVFVGGLAWETQKDTLRNYFQQFGDILEAVVITDKATARSKGYGFVTFREPEAAMRACVDATPVIDGRRANCNLAFLGAQKSKPSTPSHHPNNNNGINRNVKGMNSNGESGYGAAFLGATPSTTFPHYAIQQGIPLPHFYGYPPYSSDYTYPAGYYGIHGGVAANQYQLYGAAAAAAGGMMSCFYPYQLQFGDQVNTAGGNAAATTAYATAGTQPYGIHYPHHVFPFSSATSPQQYYSPPMSFAAATNPMQSVCFAVPQA